MSKRTHTEGAKNMDLGNEGKVMWLDNSCLQLCPDIQRKLDPARVAVIAENFDPRIANPVKVSYRDGKYFVFDGMHTRAALMSLNGGKDFPIFCRVYSGLTKEREAELFAAQFGAAAPVSMIYRLRAMEVAKDKRVLSFLQATRDSGFKINLGSRSGKNGHIAAVCEAYKTFCALGSDEYEKMLTILHRTWAGESWSVSKYMLSGMARFMQMYEVKADVFTRIFRKVEQDDIMDLADQFSGMTKDGAVASALAEIFERKVAATTGTWLKKE
ncbi:MAG: type II toxin-antitoxin system PemK/MazF family toxin [Blautia sp.]|nr:type II toxin-antitoxin system PemK/MazF family toxin [Blautia sp.]